MKGSFIWEIKCILFNTFINGFEIKISHFVILAFSRYYLFVMHVFLLERNDHISKAAKFIYFDCHFSALRPSIDYFINFKKKETMGGWNNSFFSFGSLCWQIVKRLAIIEWLRIWWNLQNNILCDIDRKSKRSLAIIFNSFDFCDHDNLLVLNWKINVSFSIEYLRNFSNRNQ